MKNRLFTKMHGLGNDYIYVEAAEDDAPAIGWPELSRRVSHRRFGVGSDGLILILPPEAGAKHGRMRIFNSDGSEAEMCGNGLRCVAKYLHDRRFPGSSVLKIATGRGVLSVRVIERDLRGRARLLEVGMGVPILDAERIPCRGMANGKTERMEVDGRSFEYMAVGMGNPHCVIFVDDAESFPVEHFGPLVENDLSRFPKRVNVEFVQALSQKEARQRTWERGSGETLACGTGASAVAVAGRLSGRLGGDVTVHLRGGDLRLRWAGPGNEIFMTGEAACVCDGTLDEAYCE